MCGDETEAEEAEEVTIETPFEFESYFDRDSGLWSLRRVPLSIPPTPDETRQAEETSPTRVS